MCHVGTLHTSPPRTETTAITLTVLLQLGEHYALLQEFFASKDSCNSVVTELPKKNIETLHFSTLQPTEIATFLLVGDRIRIVAAYNPQQQRNYFMFHAIPSYPNPKPPRGT